MIRAAQPTDRFIHTLQNDSISRAAGAGFVMDTESILWRSICDDNANGRNDGNSEGNGFSMSLALPTFKNRRNLAKRTINQPTKQPAQVLYVQALFVRASEEPRTTHRSRERRPLAMCSI